MKSAFKYLSVMLLFAMAASVAQANSYKGTLTRQGTKMEYSFSGGVATNKNYKTRGTMAMYVYVDGEVEAGSTVSGTFKKITDYGKTPQNVTVEIYAKTSKGGTKHLKDSEGKDSATASAKVPDDATEVTINMNFTGRMGPFACLVTWKVVNNKSATPKNTQTSTPGYEPFSQSGTDSGMKISISGGELKNNNMAKMIIHPGNTINMSLSYTAKSAVKAYCLIFNNGELVKKAGGGKSASLSYTIPADMTGTMKAKFYYEHETLGKYNLSSYQWKIVKNSNTTENKTQNKSTTATTNKSINWDDVAGDDRCHFCNGQFSNYYIGWNLQGYVYAYCFSNSKDSKRMLQDGLSPIYYNDYIATSSQSEVLLDYKNEKGVLFIKENSLVHLVKRNANGSDRWDIHKGCIVGKGLKHAGEPEFHMSQCVAKPTGTTYVLEDDGKTSRVYLLEGGMEVTSNKGSKKQNLQPGQVATVSSKGQINVGNFDVSSTAKKYGISGMSASKTSSTSKQNTSSTSKQKTSSTSKQNTSSNTGNQKASKKTADNKGIDRKSKSDEIKPSNSSNSSTSTPSGKYARYGAKRGIVKSVDEGDDIRMHIITWWDDYGRLERSEITGCEEKKGGKWVSSSYSQIINIIVDDKHYMYNKSIGWKQMKNTAINFLGSGTKTVNGCKLTKSGTATVAGKQCDVFKGKKGSTTIEYYIWEGVVLKRVEKDSDGTTTTTAKSIELPNSIDSSKFAIPKTGIK